MIREESSRTMTDDDTLDSLISETAAIVGSDHDDDDLESMLADVDSCFTPAAVRRPLADVSSSASAPVSEIQPLSTYGSFVTGSASLPPMGTRSVHASSASLPVAELHDSTARQVRKVKLPDQNEDDDDDAASVKTAMTESTRDLIAAVQSLLSDEDDAGSNATASS